jgi:hypothetical protein
MCGSSSFLFSALEENMEIWSKIERIEDAAQQNGMVAGKRKEDCKIIFEHLK